LNPSVQPTIASRSENGGRRPVGGLEGLSRPVEGKTRSIGIGNPLVRASTADEVNRHTALRSPLVPMTEENEQPTEHHLREAIRHLSEARDGDLRKTNATVIEDVSDTVSTVLREQERGE
jgi:hypothetical protein